MVNFYIDKIKKNLMSIEEVPKLWKKKVQEQMKE
ncbi:MAG: CD1375 family protein [Coprococcus sp.]